MLRKYAVGPLCIRNAGVDRQTDEHGGFVHDTLIDTYPMRRGFDRQTDEHGGFVYDTLINTYPLRHRRRAPCQQVSLNDELNLQEYYQANVFKRGGGRHSRLIQE